MDQTTFGSLLSSALFLALVVAVVVVLAVPSLRSRRWLVWTVIGSVVLLLVGGTIWTYMIDA